MVEEVVEHGDDKHLHPVAQVGGAQAGKGGTAGEEEGRTCVRAPTSALACAPAAQAHRTARPARAPPQEIAVNERTKTYEVIERCPINILVGLQRIAA